MHCLFVFSESGNLYPPQLLCKLTETELFPSELDVFMVIILPLKRLAKLPQRASSLLCVLLKCPGKGMFCICLEFFFSLSLSLLGGVGGNILGFYLPDNLDQMKISLCNLIRPE